jgi:hypothetical protein
MIDVVQEGIIDSATWLIITNYNQGEPDRSDSALITENHEKSHFWQAISTNFMYVYSCKYFNLCTQLLAQIKSFDYLKDKNLPLTEYINLFKLLGKQLELTDKKELIRVIDIIEGYAVFCSFRKSFPSKNDEEFKDFLKKNHEGQKIYTGAYQFMADEIGTDITFEIFSIICYISLQLDSPSDYFVDFVTNFKKDFARNKKVKNALLSRPYSFIIEYSNIDEDYFLINSYKTGIFEPNGVFKHQLLDPYLFLFSELDLSVINRIFSSPNKYSEQKVKEFSDIFHLAIQPPLTLFQNGEFKEDGMVKIAGRGFSGLLHHWTALFGVIMRIVFDKKRKSFCYHKECSYHSLNLCNKYYGFPIENYLKCQFPEMIRVTGLEEIYKKIDKMNTAHNRVGNGEPK